MPKAKRKRSPRSRTPKVARRRFRTRMVKLALCLLLLAGAGYAFHHFLRHSPYFLIRQLHIEGMQRLDEVTVRAVAGITAADNLVFLDVPAVRERVEAIPYVKECRVTRVFPDTVHITFTEREPVATVLVNSQLFEVDGEGVLLGEIEEFAPHPGPFITNVPGLAYVEVGDRLEEEALLRALAVLDAFSGIPMAREVVVSEVAAVSPTELLMFCDDLDYEIRWGRADITQQARNLDIFWRAQDGLLPCEQYVDLRFGSDIACK